MTANNSSSPRDGESKYTQSRKAYWRYQIVATAATVAALAVIAGVISLAKSGTLPIAAAFIAAGLGVVGFIWFARDLARHFDEVEREDTLWSGYIALVFFVSAYPLWHYLHDMGLTEFPKPRIMFFATCGVYFVTFCARRLGWR